MGVIETGEGVQIDPSAIISAEYCFLDDRTVVGENCIIEGRHVRIGKEGWLDRGAHIGGGSSFDPGSGLIAGDFLHMGMGSHINTARQVLIGNEVGVGRGTQIFTHGSYLSAFDGYPVSFADVTIGDRVWLPHAWVNPGVNIGNNVVVAAMSLVNKDIPSGSLAGGIPVEVLKENEYPKLTNREWWNEHLIVEIIEQTKKIAGSMADYPHFDTEARHEGRKIRVRSHSRVLSGGTVFDIVDRTIEGPVTRYTRIFKNQLRRYGIRFRYKEDKHGQYVPW